MGYTDYLLWKLLDEAGYKFVCRLKDNAKFKIVEQRKCPEKDIIADQIIEFTYNKYVERPLTEEELSHRRGRRPNSGIVIVKERVEGTYRCRRIVRRTDDGKDTVEFVTNVLSQEEMSAEQVFETYRRRWSIESLFKRLKQNFPLKYFLGDNVNAIEIQIWVTMIAYLIIKDYASQVDEQTDLLQHRDANQGDLGRLHRHYNAAQLSETGLEPD